MYDSEEKRKSTISKIGEKLKQLRKEKGFSSYETFANEYELNRVQYWRIEKGQNITIKTLLVILSIHEITLEKFFKDL
ncbi:helix-turn-helix domain-containing protein [Apibacter sp. HY039]|uniref:helix-turn-helix domain-containing protein n=1 Tax=Apibacter sp. HY039 TaxID=2501476 RepID=UPI000FEBCE86|nr:helix-turn-helix transcriptional regulator [Apibacter sp. HY039]